MTVPRTAGLGFPAPVFTGGQQFDAKSATASDVYSISPTIINEFRARLPPKSTLLCSAGYSPPGRPDVYPNLIIEH